MAKRKRSAKSKGSGCLSPIIVIILIFFVVGALLPDDSSNSTESNTTNTEKNQDTTSSVNWASYDDVNAFIENFNNSNPPQTITARMVSDAPSAFSRADLISFNDAEIEFNWADGERTILLSSHT